MLGLYFVIALAYCLIGLVWGIDQVNRQGLAWYGYYGRLAIYATLWPLVVVLYLLVIG